MTSFSWSFSLAVVFSRLFNERALLFCSHDKPRVFYQYGKLFWCERHNQHNHLLLRSCLALKRYKRLNCACAVDDRLLLRGNTKKNSFPRRFGSISR
ncbi:TPA: hypothetical protein MH645_00540 [Klebsiella pneumoniae]|nr:hypothetical protein [Klebsiella pneumoniae]